MPATLFRILRGSRMPASRAAKVVLAAALIVAGAPLITLAGAGPASALGNGLASTPQMGFNDWNAYGCDVSESLIKSTAQAMHTNGMQAAGYQYVNIDDCWLTKSRNSAGQLVPDPVKFPDGISGTAAYVHSLGLKLGIYEDAGTATCAGYPGSLGHETTDANSFASWGVDYLKYDNCNNNGVSAQTRYTAMRDALKATGRPILFSLCNWGQENVWTWGGGVGNSWRTTGDINASFGSMLSIFHNNVGLAPYAGPGGWNDPDMLEVGNGMTTTEQRSEFSLWSEMAAPLIAGTNIANASSTTLSILTNKNVVAVDQDPLGRQGTEISAGGGLDVLAKPLANGDVAVALFNENSSTATISTTASAIGKSGSASYTLTDLWTAASTTTSGAISASVPGHGTVMYRVAGGSSGGGGGSNTGELHAVGAGKCLDDPNSTTTLGTQQQIHTCDGGANQVWTHTSSNQLTVTVGGSTLCLDAYNNQTSAGTKVETWSCNGNTNQQWSLNSNGTVTGVQSGLCLDVTGGSTADGALVELWNCNGGSNQQWKLG
jgi:alpha-galactosidase